MYRRTLLAGLCGATIAGCLSGQGGNPGAQTTESEAPLTVVEPDSSGLLANETLSSTKQYPVELQAGDTVSGTITVHEGEPVRFFVKGNGTMYKKIIEDSADVSHTVNHDGMFVVRVAGGGQIDVQIRITRG